MQVRASACKANSLPVSLMSTDHPSFTNLDTLLEAYFLRLQLGESLAHSRLPLLLLSSKTSFRKLLMLSDGALFFLLPKGGMI